MIGKTGEIPNQERRAETQLAPGTMLVREYDGVTYRVKVQDDGCFDLDGRLFKSLSAWRAIAGTNYSGPVFFGLKPSNRNRKAAQA